MSFINNLLENLCWLTYRGEVRLKTVNEVGFRCVRKLTLLKQLDPTHKCDHTFLQLQAIFFSVEQKKNEMSACNTKTNFANFFQVWSNKVQFVTLNIYICNLIYKLRSYLTTWNLSQGMHVLPSKISYFRIQHTYVSEYPKVRTSILQQCKPVQFKYHFSPLSFRATINISHSTLASNV